MEALEFGLVAAFIAGIFTFLAPCTFPLIPVYLGFITGGSVEDLSNPETAKLYRKKVFLNGLFFIIGFSLVFILFGLLIGFLGEILG
ncbi:MAG TPA: cytochrome c biogenesis protein CcdA, partial [bacterium]|nr:cytochrome c biogenesis protein CcdA [bacterium]